MYYDFKNIEAFWQDHWKKNKTFSTSNNLELKKYYCLDMFPYPSSNGLHVGHIEGYTASDIVARYKRQKGFNVLHPMGWDSFGLPAEQYALKTGKDPKEFTYQNIERFKAQIERMGKSVDWNREFATSDSDVYQYTQWIFKKLYENNLAVIKETEVNWCEGLGTVLANDEIVIKDGMMVSERGEFQVVKKSMRQWVLRITQYADRLLNNLDKLDWSESLKSMQRNWIGKSIGAIVSFKVAGLSTSIDVFTTRPDTIFGTTFLVLAPENPLSLLITSENELSSVEEYIESTKTKLDFDRQLAKIKTGVFSGVYAINPINGKEIPVFIADYVLPQYGTGAIMAVPAHDTRDFEFAKAFDLDIIPIIESDSECFTEDGKHINSGFINGLYIEEAKVKVNEFLEKYGCGTPHQTFKMRDWVFSRQRYWGEPFPVLFDEEGDIILVDDKDLPVVLPKLKNIKPSGNGESPLANAYDWINTTYNGKKVRRDSNTMPQLAGSSWYFITYLLKNHLGITPLDSSHAKGLIDKWLPVDLYVGGTEHAVGHLLYARFFTMFLHDIGLCDIEEPFTKLVNQGMILGADHQKMSKSRGNVVNPDDVIEEVGADALRLNEMFLGPISSEKPWNGDTVYAAKKFLDRVVRMFDLEIVDSETLELRTIYNQTVKKVSEDYESLSFNTAISQLMIFVNKVYDVKKISYTYARNFLILLNPICPHVTEELNKVVLKHREELSYSEWPSYDENYTQLDEVEVVFQVNGKIRGKTLVPFNSTKEYLQQLAYLDSGVKKYIEGLSIVNVIVIVNKLVNIVVK
jgi:leucyl-tRNA synthetase